MPALLNITWSPPKCSTAKSTSAWTSSASATSVRWNAAARAERRPPAPRRCSASTSAMTTCAPSSTNSSAVARPIPLAPPVTIATLPDELLAHASDLLDPARPGTCSLRGGRRSRRSRRGRRRRSSSRARRRCPPPRRRCGSPTSDVLTPGVDVVQRSASCGSAPAVPRRDRLQLVDRGDVARDRPGPKRCANSGAITPHLSDFDAPVVGRRTRSRR